MHALTISSEPSRKDQNCRSDCRYRKVLKNRENRRSDERRFENEEGERGDDEKDEVVVDGKRRRRERLEDMGRAGLGKGRQAGTGRQSGKGSSQDSD